MAKDVKQQTFSGGSKSKTVTQEKEASLTAAKDRAQLTATTAMSVVHVALLKSLVEGGPDANRYYTIVIVLIVVALAIQVVIGVLAIFVTHTRNYYKTFRTNMCSETGAYWCSCFPCCDKTGSITRVDNLEVVVGKEELSGRTARNGAEAAEDAKWVLPEDTKGGLEAVTRDLHFSMSVRLLQAELAAIEAEGELKTLNRQLEMGKKRPESSVRDKAKERGNPADNSSSDVTNSPEAGQKEVVSVSVPETRQVLHPMESEKSIQEIEAGIVKTEETIQHFNVLRRQSELLGGYVGDTDANNILKSVQFWQNFINYLLYIVFICNALITGLGVSGGQAANNGGNATANAIR